VKSGLEELELWCGQAKEEVIFIHTYIRAHTHTQNLRCHLRELRRRIKISISLSFFHGLTAYYDLHVLKCIHIKVRDLKFIYAYIKWLYFQQ